MQPLPDGLKSRLASPGSLSLAGQPLWWELKVLGMAGGIPLWLVLIAGHGAVTQGELSQAPEPARCLPVPGGEHPGTPARGCCSSPGSYGGEFGQKTRRIG